jgi:hypothetical protein
MNLLLRKLENNKLVNIYLIGHTDSMGDDESNQLLSELRAKEVHKELIKMGFDNNTIDYIGYGEEQPLKTNKTKKGRAFNRRVEIILSTSNNLSKNFITARIINTMFLNNHNNLNVGKVTIATKGLTKNKTMNQIKELQKKLNTPKRRSFEIHLQTRKHFIEL